MLSRTRNSISPETSSPALTACSTSFGGLKAHHRADKVPQQVQPLALCCRSPHCICLVTLS